MEMNRVPPGQRLTTDFPVLHAGLIQTIDVDSWRLEIDGLIEPHASFTFDNLLAMPSVEQMCDIHCVTGWTKLGTRWKGVRLPDLLVGLQISPKAKHVVVRAKGGWTTNLPLEELLHQDVLAVYEYEDRPISTEHGGPVRLLVPRLYFWKSAKWMTGIEFTKDERLGYWESVGYHRLGDPWLEQRYSA